jgi:hypothetical protein
VLRDTWIDDDSRVPAARADQRLEIELTAIDASPDGPRALAIAIGARMCTFQPRLCAIPKVLERHARSSSVHAESFFMIKLIRWEQALLNSRPAVRPESQQKGSEA